MSAFTAAYRGDVLLTNDISRRYRHYDELETWWRGTWRNVYPAPQLLLYRDTMQLWRQASAVVNVYAQFVYPGPLSKDGEPLPDGTRGAIPLDPNTNTETTDQQLVEAFSMLMNLWQWSQYKSLRPKMAAIFGDCLTELIEDIPRGNILPNTLDPRDVLDIQIDDAGNVKAYTVQRRVYVPASNAYGKPRQSENYLYRKEVDGDAIRYFKDDKPYDYTGNGPVIPNPYTFVAAVWDRHEIVSYSDYGIAATEKTLPQTKILNSIMSHAMDYQQKQFAAPVGIKGATVGRPGATVSLGGPDTSPDTAWDVEEARRKLAEKMTLIQMGPEGEFVTVTSDLGQTREMLELMMDSITAENPESNYGQQLLEMTQLTAPGVERALSPIIGLVDAVRANEDPQTIKLLQMGTAIMGERLKRGDYPEDLVRNRPDRYQPFASFDLESHGKGLLECAVGPRPVFAESPDEKTLRLVQLIPVIESGDPWLMSQAGIPPEEIDRIVAEQEQRRLEAAAAFSVASGGGEEPGTPGRTGPSGPVGRTGPSGPTGRSGPSGPARVTA